MGAAEDVIHVEGNGQTVVEHGLLDSEIAGPQRRELEIAPGHRSVVAAVDLYLPVLRKYEGEVRVAGKDEIAVAQLTVSVVGIECVQIEGPLKPFGYREGGDVCIHVCHLIGSEVGPGQYLFAAHAILRHLGEHIPGVIVTHCYGEVLEEHHGSAHGVCVLRLEVRIALDKTVCIHVFLGRVEILVVRPLDTSGVGEVEHQVLRVVVAQENGRKEVEIASRGAGAGALPVSERVGVLAPESGLHRELIVEARLGKAYVCGCHRLAVSEVVPVVGQTGLGLEHLVVSH